MDKEIASQRIKGIANALGLKVQEFAAETGINKEQMYAYSSGKLLPTWPTLERILVRYPTISAEYLMRGKGAILTEQ